jgi:hypothetical protein
MQCKAAASRHWSPRRPSPEGAGCLALFTCATCVRRLAAGADHIATYPCPRKSQCRTRTVTRSILAAKQRGRALCRTRRGARRCDWRASRPRGSGVPLPRSSPFCGRRRRRIDVGRCWLRGRDGHMIGVEELNARLERFRGAIRDSQLLIVADLRGSRKHEIEQMGHLRTDGPIHWHASSTRRCRLHGRLRRALQKTENKAR